MHPHARLDLHDGSMLHKKHLIRVCKRRIPLQVCAWHEKKGFLQCGKNFEKVQLLSCEIDGHPVLMMCVSADFVHLASYTHLQQKQAPDILIYIYDKSRKSLQACSFSLFISLCASYLEHFSLFRRFLHPPVESRIQRWNVVGPCSTSG